MWAVALAVSIVATFNVDKVASRFFDKPALITTRETAINLINVPQGYFVDALSTGKCELLVQVPKNWFVIGDINWPVVIDLAGYKAGPASVTLTRELIPKLPREWVVLRFTPERVTFTLVKARQSKVRINPQYKGLAATLRIAKSSVEPAALAVDIRDPKWRDNARIETYPIDLSKIDAPGDYTLEAWLNLPDSVTPVEHDARSYKVAVTVTVAPK